MSQLELRTQSEHDRAAVREITARAFAGTQGTAPPAEVQLLDQLYLCEGFIGDYAVVAEIDGTVVGHVIATRGWVENSIPVLGLGPISVDPKFQHSGVGTALLNEIRDRATEAGERAIVLLGSTQYYPRHGYVPAIPAGITPSDLAWGDHFMVLPLGVRPLPQGQFTYAKPFGA
ncbi:GNAT family N-acetyltransferase [Leucobacter sp. HY1908]